MLLKKSVLCDEKAHISMFCFDHSTIILLHTAVFTPSQGFFNFLVYVRPRIIKHFAEKKKRRNSTTSFNSNILHVSGVSGASSMENSKRDISISEVKIEDPFLKSEPSEGAPETESTKTTRFGDTASDESKE